MSNIGDQKQFFQDLYASIEKNYSADQQQAFSRLQSDGARFSFVHDLQGIEKFTELRRHDTAIGGKLVTEALDLKRQGNAAFQAQQYDEAVRLYGRSQLLMPGSENGGAELAIVLANRSAALYHLKQYEQAIADIDLALPSYPKKMLYKLTERKARCLLAQNQFAPALQLFKQTITALDDSDLPLDRRDKLEKDAQIMVKMLPPQIAALQKCPQPPTAPVRGQCQRDPRFTELSDACAFRRTEAEGRFAVAAKDIVIGEKVLVEQPHCAVLLEKYAQTHCQHCFRRATVALVCSHCVDVVFCSSACRKTALDTYHRYECGMLRVLWNSGTSVTCHMAYRAVAQQSVEYFRQLRAELADADANRCAFERKVLKLPVADYRRMYCLERHEKVRSAESYLNYAAMAYFLTHCLRLGEFFGPVRAENGEDFDFIGSLVLRNLQLMQFNSHEVYELQKDGARTVFLGGGLYPTLALFNHSCNPGIVRYYKGTAVFVHAIANIKSGSQISENYGPLFTQNPIEDRQRLLRKQYWFDCSCEACTDVWPTFGRMNVHELRFKCDSDRPCDNVLVIPIDTDAFMVKCDRCAQFTNILKGLKAVQDTDLVGQAAKKHASAGEWRLAILKYIEMVNIMDGVMAPPFPDYCKAQQSIKDCLLQYGNKE